MKEVQGFSVGLIRQLLVLPVIFLVAGCATESRLGGEKSLPARVVRLRGAARWSSDDDKAWRVIKQGSKFPPGALVQIAADSFIDVRLGEPALRRPLAGCDKGVLYTRHPNSDNLIRFYGSTLLRLDRLTLRLDRGEPQIVEAVQLDLRAGHIFVYLTKLAVRSKYEINFPKGVVRFGNGSYDVSAEGVVKVVAGTASVTVSGSSDAHEVIAGHMFDARTGALTRIPPSSNYLE